MLFLNNDFIDGNYTNNYKIPIFLCFLSYYTSKNQTNFDKYSMFYNTCFEKTTKFYDPNIENIYQTL